MTCLDYFYYLLSRGEYSAYQLTKKAKEKKYEQDEIAQAIEELQNKDYQSDTRVVEGMITSYQGKYGKSMIKRKCREKGIAADLFDQVWQLQTEDQDTENLDDLKAKVIRKYKIDDFSSIEQKTKARVWNYLQYRGFHPGNVLAQWQQQQEEE